jgi:hypothetical protein
MNNPDCVSVEKNTVIENRMEELNSSTKPTSFALVPERYEKSDGEVIYVHKESTQTLRKLFQKEDIREDPIESEEIAVIHERDAAFFGPILFLTADFIINHWDDIVALIDIIQTYAEDRSASTATLELEYESPEGEVLKVDYEGDPDNLPQILKPIESDYEETHDNDENLETTDAGNEG